MQDVRGQLGKGILPDVLRHVAFLRDTGRLVLHDDARQGLVVIRAGRPVHAACRRPDGSAAQGLEALATLLGWERGTYRFDLVDSRAERTEARRLGGAEPGDTLAGDVEELLEAARSRRATNGSVHGVRASEPSRSSVAPVAPGIAEGAMDWDGDHEPHDAGDDDPFDEASAEHVFLFPPTSLAAVSPGAVLSRREIVSEGGDVALPRGALSLWLRLDGATSLAEHAGAMGADQERAIAWAARLVDEGLAEVEPEPVVSPEFVRRLCEELIDIMGPMGEILMEEAVYELGLDPEDLTVARVPELVDALASQLHRSDWQMKLRARATRLQHEMTISPRAKRLP